ncbi:MAG: glycine--tRNA ligase subunit beta [Clostridiales bacterium]|uniref:glycine--tRNA ligase subunit beta n=1 Tax=Terrisporobacter sp. TaxID=1965305 RepID=UPI002A58DC12|nr:glycine--tRNA ligase subunit beta [Terrisporobacter sp.]MDD7753546.1 glycine--tRNA ligase subunit beta [Clostridiales bacterium]MDY4136957.1 glycine--tRNA ligase subunit beta [Terrisporobacter sp.]
MNNYLLLEIGVEELPSRFGQTTLDQIENNLSKLLKEERINFDNIEKYATPRRLTFVIKNLADKATDLEEEVKGPAKKIAVDDDGNFTKPALGFMKSKGLDPENVYFKQLGNAEYLFGTIKQEGKHTSEVLKNIVPEAIKNVTFPKAMRWGGKNMRFARPIRWMVALLNNEVLDIDLEGIKSSNITRGHRFLGEKEFEVNSVEEYFEKLDKNFVVLDQHKRKEMIREQAVEVAKSLGGEVELDEDLLEEITFLVEYPTAFYGEFDEEYVKLPKEVVTTPMKEHQRYFPVSKDGKLLPNFIAVRNGDSNRIDLVKAGNEKVLRARLADALFFYHEDTKKPLESFVDKLQTVVFQAKLGTVYDKTLRIEKLSQVILNELNMTESKENTLRAAKLCKADLVTNMVFEFTELQGIMGRDYAQVSGENEEVCQGIFEHYLPRFAGDILPETNTGIALSIADKLDSIAGFFAIGIKPSGSQDPYALRRQALGILSILLDRKLSVNLNNLINAALDNYSNLEFNKEEVASQIVEFFVERVKNLFKDLGIRYDVIDAVLNNNLDDISDIHTRALELNRWLQKDELVEMLTAFNRVATLAEKATTDIVKEDLLKEDAEIKLYNGFKEIKSNVESLLLDKKYNEALDAFATLRPLVDNLFDNVMVMDKDEAIKENRLGLLKQIYSTMLTICDLSKIVYK